MSPMRCCFLLSTHGPGAWSWLVASLLICHHPLVACHSGQAEQRQALAARFWLSLICYVIACLLCEGSEGRNVECVRPDLKLA